MDSHKRDKGGHTAVGWSALGIWGIFLMLVSSQSKQVIEDINKRTANLMERFIYTLFEAEISPVQHTLLVSLSALVLIMAGYAVFALLLWYNLRIKGMNSRRCLILSLAGTILFSIINELHLLLYPGRLPELTHWVKGISGGVLMLGWVAILGWLLDKYPRWVNRETISYLVFGVLTTLVNLITYGVCYNIFGVHNLISNAIAWAAAVIFAYVVNKLFVFRSHTHSTKQALREFGLFIGARVLSFAVDELGMWLLVNILALNSGISKIGMNIIVLIINYIFSKRFIFSTQPESHKN
ncbi:MAG: GtrA family protein [Oscillospiraceae bacterium]|nr:GtrA family protein [Oscillospiraceae bacterium]MDD3832618.1 GtrA family protein [Oscillospiraceae bacterium]MDD4545924.1 GtrA family protein [Oscillospiraceae bacterium]